MIRHQDAYDFEDRYEESPRLIHSRGLWFLVVSLASLGLLSLIAVLLDAFQEPPITLGVRGIPKISAPGDTFVWKGIVLGSTLGTVRQAHPGLQATVGRQGLATGSVPLDKGTARLFFLDGTDDGRVYRVQTVETVRTADMAAVVAPLLMEHGRPAARSCREGTLQGGGTECDLTWWLRGTTRLEVNLKLGVSATGPAETQMTATVTNAQLEGLTLRGDAAPR
jgi:hypothetical protein